MYAVEFRSYAALCAAVVAVLTWFAWAPDHGWSPLATGATGIGALAALIAGMWVWSAATEKRYSGWNIGPDHVLVVSYTYMFGLATRESRYDLTDAAIVHEDSHGRLVMRGAAEHVTTWMAAWTRTAHPDLDAGIRDHLRAHGSSVSAAPERTEMVLATSYSRAQRLTREVAAAAEHAWENDLDLPPSRPRAWSRARQVQI